MYLSTVLVTVLPTQQQYQDLTKTSRLPPVHTIMIPSQEATVTLFDELCFTRIQGKQSGKETRKQGN